MRPRHGAPPQAAGSRMVTTCNFIGVNVEYSAPHLRCRPPRPGRLGHRARLRAQGHTNIVTRSHAGTGADRPGAGARVLPHRAHRPGLPGRGQGGRHPCQQHLSGGIHLRQHDGAGQRRARGLARTACGSCCSWARPASIRAWRRSRSAKTYLMSGMLEPTNEPYAMAKIAGIKLCESYNRQYGTDYRSVMPTNLYGPGDNYHPENSHVIPALLRRFHEAKLARRRSRDLGQRQADARVPVRRRHGGGQRPRDEPRPRPMPRTPMPMHSHINVGTGEDVTIAELARLVGETVGYRGASVRHQQAGRHAAQAARRVEAEAARLAGQHPAAGRIAARLRRLRRAAEGHRAAGQATVEC
jgi:GDP-L-fucose synthase